MGGRGPCLPGAAQESLLRMFEGPGWVRARLLVMALEGAEIGESRAYRDLRVLWRRGWVERRDEGRGRGRCVEYRITEAGRSALAEVAA
jgi:hypothetical protein